MLMGYFNTPENKRADVVRVIGGLLGFTHEELEKVRGQKQSNNCIACMTRLIAYVGACLQVAMTAG